MKILTHLYQHEELDKTEPNYDDLNLVVWLTGRILMNIRDKNISTCQTLKKQEINFKV